MAKYVTLDDILGKETRNRYDILQPDPTIDRNNVVCRLMLVDVREMKMWNCSQTFYSADEAIKWYIDKGVTDDLRNFIENCSPIYYDALRLYVTDALSRELRVVERVC